ncbi:MAG TPA: LysR family transcriptional regulator [Sphingomonas sp.]|uniref:LysR family transcriptional regulator n=1 Tax=Sphingomonas sp. TaxID=28214 RepID=UPI002D03E9A9|nr:LysR family transcriptional regulator [Sphingomonas sp.]HMI18150.1 LysR family transcriptional regulator [Sphingomonas sp.]
MTRDLEVRHCRVLVAVHEQGGVGAAARALGVAQSTVSETLLSLERLLGAPVTLRRAGREATLTAAAEALLPHAQALISVSETALAASARRATIRFGTVESISSFLLPGPLSDFRLLWPQVDVRISIGLCEDLRKRVGRSDLDAALTIEAAGRPRDRDLAEDYWPARLRLVAAPDHPLAGRVVQRRDLEGRTCLLTDHDGAFSDLVKAWVGSGARPPKLESAGSVDGVKRGVLKSDAIGVLPDYAVADELAARSLAALGLADPLPPVSLCLTTLKPPPAASPLESLIGNIRDGLQRLD